LVVKHRGVYQDNPDRVAALLVYSTALALSFRPLDIHEVAARMSEGGTGPFGRALRPTDR